MGFATPSRRDGNRHVRQVVKALTTGRGAGRTTNTEVIYEGTARPLQTFRGHHWLASGLMSFWHHDTLVLQMDFDRDMITDFGYLGYSMTTNTNLNGWSYALGNLRLVGCDTPGFVTGVFPWTFTGRNDKNGVPINKTRGAGHAEDMFTRFRARVPWVQTIRGIPWFSGRRFDPVLANRFHAIRGEILEDGVSWHWFTADWDANGQWNKRFIDAAAEKRWHARQKRMTKAA